MKEYTEMEVSLSADRYAEFLYLHNKLVEEEGAGWGESTTAMYLMNRGIDAEQDARRES